MKTLFVLAVILIAVLAAVSLIPATPKEPDHSVDRAVIELKRVMAEDFLIGAVLRDCLAEPLSSAQKEYLTHRSEYENQTYIFALADAACQQRHARFCEKHYPAQCLAVPGEVRGKLPSE